MVETRMVIVSCPKRRDAEELRKWCFSRWGSRVRKLNPVSPVRKQDSGGYSFHLKLAGQYEEFSEDLNLLEKITPANAGSPAWRWMRGVDLRRYISSFCCCKIYISGLKLDKTRRGGFYDSSSAAGIWIC